MLKRILLVIALFVHAVLLAQQGSVKNVILITTDGFRWQEVFNGMDATLAADKRFSQGDSVGVFKAYWAATAAERRQKLMPFLWGTVAAKGRIYGNRALGNKVNVANPYWFSYPGYNELLTGFVDTAINTNAYPPNPNTNLFEWLNCQAGFKGHVAAFGAWDAFDRILNEKRSGFPVVCGMDSCGGSKPDAQQALITQMKATAYNPFGGEEALDMFTHYAAMEQLKQHPRALYISYGETDEWAHASHYKDYLNAAHAVDKWIGDIWNYVQSDPFYRDNTVILVTVDHGRGNGDQWTSHNSKIPDSDQIWFAVIGAGIKPGGEVNGDMQLYQRQVAGTLAQLLHMDYKCEHPVADGFAPLLAK